jgi:hypothetical protein
VSKRTVSQKESARRMITLFDLFTVSENTKIDAEQVP